MDANLSPFDGYEYLALAALSFLLGLLASSIADSVRRIRDRTRLIDLFVTDIRRNWLEVDGLQMAPTGRVFSRLRSTLKGVGGLRFTGEPEYLFEVYDLKLFETEGVRLAQVLPSEPRAALWEAYALIRDAEAVRRVLNNLTPNTLDYASYQELFTELVKRLAWQLIETETLLWRERAWWTKLVGRKQGREVTA